MPLLIQLMNNIGTYVYDFLFNYNVNLKQTTVLLTLTFLFHHLPYGIGHGPHHIPDGYQDCDDYCLTYDGSKSKQNSLSKDLEQERGCSSPNHTEHQWFFIIFFSIHQILEPISLLPMFYIYNSVFDFTAKPKYALDIWYVWWMWVRFVLMSFYLHRSIHKVKNNKKPIAVQLLIILRENNEENFFISNSYACIFVLWFTLLASTLIHAKRNK